MFAFFLVLLAAASLVGWWGLRTGLITMDSPFSSFRFRDYALFSFIGEVVLGLPYAFSVRALLKHFGRWSVPAMWLAALTPGLIVTLLETYVEQRPAFGPCLLLAATVIAARWQAIGFDREVQHAHG